MEEEIVADFKSEFLTGTFRMVAENSLCKEASDDAQAGGISYEEAEGKLIKEFIACGEFPYSFDSGTQAALRQVRNKAQIARIGSLSLVIDEIGNNLLNSTDLFTVGLDLYDKGLLKAKIIKNSADNVRGKDRSYPVPMNLLCFGTPAKLYDGGKVEAELDSILVSGYARRFDFAVGKRLKADGSISAEDRYNNLTNSTDAATIARIRKKFSTLADSMYYKRNIPLLKPEAIESIKYQMYCEKRAEEYPDHAESLKAEMTHRYFKALKKAGGYAFVDGTPNITMAQLHAAIKLTEDGGEDFQEIAQREKPYIKLAKFLAGAGKEITHADLAELPFYTGTSQNKKEMLMLAVAWGHKNNIIVKRVYVNGVELLVGETLAETDMDEVIISMSTKLGTEYESVTAPFDKLSNLTQEPGYHWCNHHTKDERRRDESMIPGFNVIVIDVDGGCDIATAQLLMKKYSYHMYTTKRSTPEENRFRLVLPMSHTLKFAEDEYKEFMNNVYSFLPFDCDTATNQRCKKWLSHKGDYYDNEGEKFDVLQFIPKTDKNAEREKTLSSTGDLSNLERWFLSATGNGNRSNSLIKYALMLVDSGRNLVDIQTAVMEFNDKLRDGLTLDEIMKTIMKTVAKAVQKRDA